MLGLLAFVAAGRAHAIDPAAHVPAAEPAPKTSAADLPLAHVSPPAEPTVVKVGMYLIGIPSVAPPSTEFPSYTAEIFMDLEWRDPRLAFDPEVEGTSRKVYQDGSVDEELRQIWWPNVEIENEEGSRKIEVRTLAVHADGTVEYTERFAATMHTDFDLVRFPFDTQTFEVRLEPFSWDERYVTFVPYPERSGFDESFQMLEYDLLKVAHRIESVREIRSNEKFSRYVFTIDLERRSGYYLWKLVLPLLIVVAFTWSAFFMTGEAYGTRMQRSFVSLLTLVAFHQVLARNLPRISYLSFLDGVAFLALISVGLTLLQIIVAHRATIDGDPERAARLDRMARWVVPGIFVIGLVVLWIVFHG